MSPDRHPFRLGGPRGWVTMVEQNFGSMAYQLLSGDAVYDVGGENWEKIHSAGERANCELNAGGSTDGINIKPAQNPTCTPTQWDAPAFYKSAVELVPDFDLSMGLRISIYVASMNPNANYDRAGVFIGSKVATNSDNGVMWKADRGRMGTGNNGIESAVFVNGSNVSGYLFYDTTATYYTSKEEVILQIDRLDAVNFLRFCDAGAVPYYGPYDNSIVGTIYNYSGYGTNYKLRRTIGCGFYAFRAGSATLLEVKIKAVKIEVKFR